MHIFAGSLYPLSFLKKEKKLKKKKLFLYSTHPGILQTTFPDYQLDVCYFFQWGSLGRIRKPEEYKARVVGEVWRPRQKEEVKIFYNIKAGDGRGKDSSHD